MIEIYKKEGKVVHVIRGEAKEVSKLGEMLNMELPEFQDRIHHPVNPWITIFLLSLVRWN